MKILEQEDISKWSYVHKCNVCNTKLEVYHDDIVYERHPRDACEPESLNPETFTARCCVCEFEFSIIVTSIPKLMQVQFRQKYKK